MVACYHITSPNIVLCRWVIQYFKWFLSEIQKQGEEHVNRAFTVSGASLLLLFQVLVALDIGAL